MRLQYDPTVLPPDLPAPDGDGRSAHLAMREIPSISLPATDGSTIELGAVLGRAVVFAYPRTGRPDEPPLVADWDSIPGARGCTPQACSFRDLAQDFAAHGCRVFGISTQEPAYQCEMAERLHLPFQVLSDADLLLTTALSLPTLMVADQTLLARLAWVQDAGKITHVFYPVFPPDKSAQTVLAWIAANPK